MKTGSQTSVPEAFSEPVVEILDKDSRIVAILPAAEARRQMLPHRTVVILMQDELERVYIRKRHVGKAVGPKRWDVSARGQVWAGESVREAAARVLEETLGIRAERLRQIHELKPMQEHGNELVHVFWGMRPSGAANALDNTDEGTFFSAEEVLYLINEFRELVAPRFLTLVQAAGLFMRPGRRG